MDGQASNEAAYQYESDRAIVGIPASQEVKETEIVRYELAIRASNDECNRENQCYIIQQSIRFRRTRPPFILLPTLTRLRANDSNTHGGQQNRRRRGRRSVPVHLTHQIVSTDGQYRVAPIRKLIVKF